ncbi:MAG: MFS transporter [Ignavibacteriales bacterium]|nr:MFS transporter [Ignavibacteriales bacterium]
MFKKHPSGLPVLFFTEMWERFGFYLMLGIFVLYMNAKDGMGFSLEEAADIYGTYLALVYLTPFLGGLLADRHLGYRKSIFIGGILMGLGYLGLGTTVHSLFWPSLLMIIFGNGFFKPNISTLVGNLYTEENKKLKDSGYNIFYMGINIGAFVCNFIAAYLRNSFGWGYAFAAAGIGMFIGVIWFALGQKHVKEADVMKPKQPEDRSLWNITGTVFAPAIIAGVIGWFLPGLLFGEGATILGAPSTDAFLFAAIPIALFYLFLFIRASSEDREPVGALLAIFGVVIVFWAVFHQNGAALTVWARDYTDRAMPEVVEPVAEKLGFTQVVTDSLREVEQLDTHGVPVTGADGKPVTVLGPDPYFNNVPETERPADGKMVLISTEIFQSVNPFFVVVLTPVVVGFFTFLRKRKKEPSTPAKIGYGLLITAASTLVMVAAVFAAQNGAAKASPLWLIMSYGVITIGELFLSPMGLSLVSKLSPPRITSLMMGGWFVSTALGNKLSGVLSGLWTTYDHKAYFFLVNFIGAAVAGLSVFAMLKWLRRVVKEHTGDS